MQEAWVPSLGQEDPLEEEMATHFSILAWEIPWTEEPCGLHTLGSQRARHDLITKQQRILTIQRQIRYRICCQKNLQSRLRSGKGLKKTNVKWIFRQERCYL